MSSTPPPPPPPPPPSSSPSSSDSGVVGLGSGSRTVAVASDTGAVESGSDLRSLPTECADLPRPRSTAAEDSPPHGTRLFTQGDWAEEPRATVHQEAPARTPTPAPEAHDLPELPVGTPLPLRPDFEVRIAGTLGRGGMGVVYLVEDPQLGARRAALKLIRARDPNPAQVRRFRREILITACLNHPSIPPVIEAGVTAAGQHYLLMRYVRGESLETRLRALWAEHGPAGQPRHETRKLLDVLVRVGEAMAHAHTQRIVHRDLKPDNIMIGAFGEVVVMDWGLARNLKESDEEDRELREGFKPVAASSQENLTRVGATMGTLGYMAPEQARGEQIDARVDVFSLGAILGLVLTGRYMQGDRSLELLDNSMQGFVRRPCELCDHVPPELDAIAAKALAPDREARYPSAQAFSQDLKAYLEGRPVSVYSYRPVERALLTIRRHPTLAVALLAGLIVLGLAFAQQLHKRGQHQAFLAAGEQALRDRDPDEARNAFERARGIEDGASVHMGLALVAQLEEEQARERVSELLEQAARALEDGRLHDARELYLRVQQSSASAAAEGLRRLKLLEAEAERRRQKSATHQELVQRSQTRIEEAKQAMAAGDLRDAYLRLSQALAYEFPGLREQVDPILSKVNERLVQQRVEEMRRANRARAASFVSQGQGLLQDDPAQARTQFERALGLDNASAAAKQGLRRAYRRLGELRGEERQAARLREARERLAKGRALRQEGRLAYRKRTDLLVVLESYFSALEQLHSGLSQDPTSKPLRAEQRELGAELASILRQEGQAPFADFVLRWCKAEALGSRRDVLPRDPYVEVVEGDAVLVRQILGEATRFAPTQVFDGLRAEIKKHANRFRIVISLRSKVGIFGNNPRPRVQFTAIDIKREDKKQRTSLPLRSVPIAGTFVRHYQGSKVGRVVFPIESATDPSVRGRLARIPIARYVERVRQIVRQSLPRRASELIWHPLAEEWTSVDLPALHLSLELPEGLELKVVQPPDPDWRARRCKRQDLTCDLYVHPGPLTRPKLARFVERRLGVARRLWRPVRGFRKSATFAWARSIRLADSRGVNVVLYGQGDFGSYVMVLQTTEAGYAKDPAGFRRWLQGARPDEK